MMITPGNDAGRNPSVFESASESAAGSTSHDGPEATATEGVEAPAGESPEAFVATALNV